MAAVFLKLLNLSISASWLVLAVLVLRLISKRSPKWVNVLLWGIVALRLVLPFSIESAVSLIPSAETVSPAAVQFDPAPTITSGVSVIDNAVNPSLSEHFSAVPTASVNPLYVWTEIAGWVWLIGLGAMLLYALVSYLRLRRRVSVSLCVRENIYLCDAISSPFILGVVKPRIYLPSGLDEVQRQNVLSHERAHLARRDHWWKPLGFALLAVYWFNPALWLAYTLLCRDIELACDERVIRTMDESAVKTYSTVLLACSMPRKAVITCPLAFGEVGVKERVRNALRYKKPAFWVVAASVAVCVVVAVCFLTNPPRALSKVCGDFWDTEAVCTYTEEQPNADARYTTANGTVRLSEHLALVRIGAARPEKKSAVNPKWSSLYLALPGADGAPAERLTIDFIREYDAPGGTKATYTLNIGTRDDSKSYKVLSGQDEIEEFLAYLRGDAAEDADHVYTESFRPENGSSDSAVPPTDPEEGWIMSLVFIDSGNINNQTGLDTSKKLNKGNGKYVSLYIENKGSNPVVATIDGQSERIFKNGESGHIYVEVTQGLFGADKSYNFKVVPGTNGGTVDIYYEIAQRDSVTGYPAAYDELMTNICNLRSAGARDIETDFSHDLLSENDYYQTPGWLLRDLDGDGIPELLLGADWGDGHSVIFNIYRLDGAKAVRVVDGWNRSRWYLCADGSLANEGSSSAFESSYSYYRYTSGELQHLETLLYLDDGSGGSPWRYSVTTDQYVNSGDFHSVTEAEATAVMDKYTHETLAFTPFVV